MQSSYPPHIPSEQTVIAQTQQWVESMVIGLNLCPFARAEHVAGRIHYTCEMASDDDRLLGSLRSECTALVALPAGVRETTLLIMPQAWADFWQFHHFLPRADKLLKTLGLRGIVQIAPFHPQFVFAGNDDDAVDNYTNRSPWPTLHLLREDSIARASASMQDTSSIYQANIHLLQTLGQETVARRLLQCSKPKPVN